MGKRGTSMFVISVVIILIISGGLITWTIINDNSKKDSAKTSQNIISSETDLISQENQINSNDTLDININQTLTNQTEINKTNQTIINQTETLTIPNPIGSITILERNNPNAGYFCNGSENLKHQIRLYTYKIINGIKNLSEEYIESDERTNVCSLYSNLNMSIGMNYELEWKWTPVEDIDGYMIYQYYYKNVNVSRDFDHFVILRKEATRLIDTELSIWQSI